MNKISTIIFIKNALKYEYPFKESIQSIYDLSSQIIILEGFSNDGTYEKLNELYSKDKKVNIKRVKTVDNKGNKITLDSILKEGVDLCENEWILLLHPDEVLIETTAEFIKSCLDFSSVKALDGFAFNFHHFFQTPYQILSPLVSNPEENDSFHNSMRLFKKKKDIEFIGNGWGVEGSAVNLKGMNLHHYHFMRSYSAISAELAEQTSLYHYIPPVYKYFISDPDYLRYFYSSIKSFNLSHPKYMKKIIKDYFPKSEKIRRLPKVLFGMDFYNENFLSDIYDTGIIQKEWEIHEFEWKFGNMRRSYLNGIYRHYCNELKKYEFIDIFNYLNPDILVLIGSDQFFENVHPFFENYKGNLVSWINHDIDNSSPAINDFLKRCQKVLTFSKWGAENITVESDIIPIGVNNKFFNNIDPQMKNEIRKKRNIPADSTIFLCGDSSPKAILLQMEAYERICSQINRPENIYMAFIHSLPDLLINWIISHRYNEKFIFFNDRNPFMFEDKIDLYNISDVFISTDFSMDVEIYIREAIASGLPCILSDMELLREITDNKEIFIKTISTPEYTKDKILFRKIPDMNELTKVMIDFLNNRDKYMEKENIQIHSWDYVAQKLLTNLNEVIKSNRVKGEFKYSPHSFKLLKF